MNQHYVLIQWPDSQQVIDTAMKEGWDEECIFANPDEADHWIGHSAYFVPVERIEMMKRVTRENVTSHLLMFQLDMVDKTRVDIIDDDRWRFNWTITREQYKKFRGYAIPLLRKTFKCNRLKAEENFDFFFQQFGLRIKN